MNASTAVMTLSTSPSGIPGFWERLWRSSGIQFVICFVIVYAIYAHQPQVDVSSGGLVAFYGGNQARVLIAAIFSSLNVLSGCAAQLMFPIALRKNTQTDTKVQ